MKNGVLLIYCVALVMLAVSGPVFAATVFEDGFDTDNSDERWTVVEAGTASWAIDPGNSLIWGAGGFEIQHVTDHVIAGGEVATFEIDINRTGSQYTYFGDIIAWDGAAASVLGSYSFNDVPSPGTYTVDISAGAGQQLGVTYGHMDWGESLGVQLDVVALNKALLVYPTPSGTDFVPTDADLEWGPPPITPNYYDLWFGDPNTNPWNLTPLGWTKKLDKQNQTEYDPAGNLAFETTYYWRVDVYEPNTVGDIFRIGNMWSFTTAPDLPIILSQPQSVTVGASDTAVFTVGGVNLTTAQWYKDGLIMTGETSTTLTIGPPVLIGDEAAYYCVVGDGDPGKDVVSATARLLTKRLFAQWTFESTIDAVVGGFTGIYNDPNDPASAGAQFDNTDPSPQGGYAIKFGGDTTETEGDGYGESVSASEPNAAFNFYPLGLTASAWVKYDATSSGAWSTIVGKQHREDPLPWTGWGLIKAADDSPVFTTRQTSSDVYGTTNLLDDTWHLVTGTYDGETTRIYVDGELETEASSTSAMDINDKALIIGAERVDGLSPMNGLIDDVQIYTHALTGFEVLGLYGTPIITEHPVNQTISAGLTATLTVSVYSNPVVPETGGYEWFKDNSPVSGVKYSGEDSNTLTIDDFQAGEEGAYYCEVTNSNDTVTSETANLILPQLVSHWTFDTGDNLTDTVGSNDGSAFGADGPTYDPNAIVGDQALVLDGTEPNDVVVVPYDYGLNSTQFTVSLWAKVAGGAGTWRSPICSRSEDVTHTYGFNLYASMYDTWEFWSGDPGALAWYGIGSAPVVEDEWAYLVMTYDATTLEKKLYVNGELDAEETVPLPVNPSPNALQIGGNAFSGALFDGSIDDVKVYGYVRDAYDIAEEYVGIVPTAGVCPDPSTGLDYDLDGDCDVDIADFAEFAAKWYNCNRVAGTSSGEVDCK
jgi:hypothetical protein